MVCSILFLFFFNFRICYVNATHGLIITKFDSASSQFVQSMILSEHHQTVRAVLYHPTMDILVSSGVEGVFVWDLRSGTLMKQIKFDFSVFFTLVS